MAGFKLFGVPMNRYEELLEKANVKKEDHERKALLYILAKNRELYKKAEYLYDFESNEIKPESIEKETINLSNDARKMAILAFNLFNGFTIEDDDVSNIFSLSSDKNYVFARHALNIRFNRGSSFF